MTEPCRVCDAPTEYFADGTVLGDVPVRYTRCSSCGALAATEPTWLDRAYSEAISRYDVGLLDRCQTLANVTAAVLRSERLRTGNFLDWAGGYGTFTRMMRDRGYHFVHDDPFATNLFAGGHEPTQGEGDGRYDLVTAFEVLEHLSDPAGELAAVARSTDRLLATTQTVPDPPPRPGNWEYYSLETGQHITFYTPKALTVLAQRLGFDGVVTGPLTHLFYRGRLSAVTRALITKPAVSFGLGHLAAIADRRHSLLAGDAAAVSSAARP